MVRMSSKEGGTSRRAKKRNESRDVALNDDTRHGITAVILFVVAGLSLLSFLDLAGPFGRQLDALEGALLGWARYVVPVPLLVIGMLLFRNKKEYLRTATYLGMLLLALGMTGLLHLFYSADSSLSEATLGHGGGYLGYGLAMPLTKVAGTVAAFLILAALGIIGLLVTFNTSLNRMRMRTGMVGNAPGWLRRIASGGRPTPGENEEPVVNEYGKTFSRRTINVPENDPHKDAQHGISGDVPLETFSLPKMRKVKKLMTSLPLDLLTDASTKPTSGDLKANAQIIQRTLQNFGIDVEMGEINIGPTVTQYTLKPAEGVKLSQIVTLQNDLALALAAHPIRIEAPIPGKSLVGIEVPNKATAVVSLKEILSSEEFRNKKSHLALALGKDVAGHPVLARLDSMPHLLIAGATGSGKSVCINSVIVSLLYQNDPDQLKFILVDPKRVELTVYNDIPHLITPVITDVRKTVNALKWVVAEMERRYKMLAEVGVRNIAGHNALTNIEPLPYIVIIIDELADLMAASANEVEGAIVRLAQMARAVGIHLIVATQRPSVDVITGLIKANITSRIAFSVASLIDSRTIIDGSGAEKLLGRGDMLYLSAELSKPKRLQGALVSDEEIQRVVDHLKTQANPEYEETVISAPAHENGGGSNDAAEDELYEEAKSIVIQAGKASASLLQRRLRVGYARAARLLDILEENGVIGPIDGARPRKVFLENGQEAAPEEETPTLDDTEQKSPDDTV